MAAIRIILPLLLLTYPLVSHFAATSAHPQLSYLWIGLILVSAGLGRTLNALSSLSIVSGLALIGASISLAGHLAELPVRLLPVVTYLSISFLFAYTLLPGNRPLITRIVQHLRDDCPPSVLAYSRNLTGLWALLLLLLGVQSLLLGLFAAAPLWSLFTNFAAPALIALAFVIEYWVRRRVLKEVPHKGFFGYILDLARTGFPKSDPGFHARR